MAVLWEKLLSCIHLQRKRWEAKGFPRCKNISILLLQLTSAHKQVDTQSWAGLILFVDKLISI